MDTHSRFCTLPILAHSPARGALGGTSVAWNLVVFSVPNASLPMQTKYPQLVLEVLGGDDHGAHLSVDERIRTVGRSRGADLVLQDLSVSRQHLQVVATPHGVHVEVCGGAAAFLVDGRAFRSAEAREGDRLVVGSTTLAVRVADAPSEAVARGPSDVRTVLTGVGADARGMASIHALIEALDAARDRAALEAAIAEWGANQTPVAAVELVPSSAPASTITERDEADSLVLAVPAPSEEGVALAFRFKKSDVRVTESFRRTIVVAGRLFGSALERVRRQDVSDGEVAALRSMSFGSAHDFLGTSSAAQQLAAKIPKLATSDVGLLVDGETGVGKTFVARLIHEAGPRAREPMRVLNCAAIPDALVESELFGHERGAFTGANARRAGAFEAVGGGTLVLDEVGELSLAAQAKLLRVLEERRFERVGSNQTLAFRARVICATNRDLEAMVAAGTFRRDLLFRIAVVRVRVPALRERVDDLPVLASQLLADAARSAGRRIEAFTPAALELIRRHSWPGNVRELRNAIEHAVVFAEGARVDAGDLPVMVAPPAQPEDPDLVRLPLDLPTLERRTIEAALRATKNNRLQAAALIGMNRSSFYLKLKEFGLF